MDNNRSMRFAKLIAHLKSGVKPLANPGIDDRMAARLNKEPQLQAIDAKIAEIEASDDPNVLQTLEYWKQKRSELSAD